MLAAASGLSVRGAGAVPYSAGDEPPRLTAPENASDCHMHIYDSRFPIAQNATHKPADAVVDDYRQLL